jgi:hypothetical protein
MRPRLASPRLASPRDRARLRQWLEYVAQTAIDWLDELDAPFEDLEDDELGDDDTLRRRCGHE